MATDGPFLKQASIGDPILTNPNSCRVANHFDKYDRDGVRYEDVLKINCGKDSGYFAKNKGIIFFEVDKNEEYMNNDVVLKDDAVTQKLIPNNIQSGNLLNIPSL